MLGGRAGAPGVLGRGRAARGAVLAAAWCAPASGLRCFPDAVPGAEAVEPTSEERSCCFGTGGCPGMWNGCDCTGLTAARRAPVPGWIACAEGGAARGCGGGSLARLAGALRRALADGLCIMDGALRPRLRRYSENCCCCCSLSTATGVSTGRESCGWLRPLL